MNPSTLSSKIPKYIESESNLLTQIIRPWYDCSFYFFLTNRVFHRVSTIKKARKKEIIFAWIEIKGEFAARRGSDIKTSE